MFDGYFTDESEMIFNRPLSRFHCCKKKKISQSEFFGYMKYAIVFSLLFITATRVYSQGSFSLSTPVIYNTVEVTNNYGPQRQIKGTSWGYGANVVYSFAPKFLKLTKNFTINIGGGYFKQQFNLTRPFRYHAPAEVLYYTKSYSYDNFHGIVGLSYNFPVKHNYSFDINVLYNWLGSIRQKYTPNHYGAPDVSFNQIEHKKHVFGNIITSSIGLKKHWKDKYSFGLNLIIPLHTQWRMDQIFYDDPTKYFHPKSMGGNISSIGCSISIGYYLKAN